MAGAFWGTRFLEIVKKHDSGGKVWKKIKLTPTRKANAKKRLLRHEAVLKALSAEPPSGSPVAGDTRKNEKAATASSLI
ncbi:hypothetical protein MKX01_009922 [Papaver californicum]|nr:hypothetical protein MKX01_009922 [Papaver californicum]